MARAADFDLAAALATPSFTPGARDASALVELVVAGEEPAAQRAATALAKLGAPGHAAVDTRLAGGGPVGGDTGELSDAATARLVGVLGQLARGGDAAALTALVERTRDAHVRVRRAAINALGKVRGDAARDALLARWDGADVTPDERRALVEALGKIGGEAVIAKLGALEAAGDVELERRRKRAKLMAERSATRDTDSEIAIDVKLPVTLPVVLRCKPGLAPLLVDELGQRGLPATARGNGAAVIARFSSAWQALYASRLWSAASLEVPLAPGPDLKTRIVTTLGSAPVRSVMTALTRGALRYRIGFPQGHRRSLVWQLATTIDWLVNDPTDTTWDIFIDDGNNTVALTPKKAADPRFAWRVAEVPAASHPTVAAALAFVGGARPTDRVWDPFTGSGAELVERARLGPCAALVGSDIDDEALAASRQNVDAAGLTARLERGDARTFDPGGVDLILTNPPLGSRVQLDAVALLVAAMPHFARVLAPGGRLVWITPSLRRTGPAAEQAGLRCTRSYPVDLGGVRGHLERWER
jgi:SAM-dependent methyltransferase